MSNVIAGYLVMGLAAALFWVSYRVRQAPTFRLVLLNRWLRWGLFGVGMAYLVRDWGGSYRPYWALAPTFLLIWMLVESVYTWLAVRALSLSSLPVFPSYRGGVPEVNWPVEPRFLKVKEEIRSLGFTVREKMRAELGEYMTLTSVIYADEENKTRLQVIFVPRPNSRPALFFIFTSKSESERWGTENVWLPFGGVVPRSWHIDRKPFCTSPAKLLQRHRRKIEKAGEELVSFDDQWVDELNEEQDTLDRVSTEEGILFSRRHRPEYGKLTGDGRYRVWKQILLLNFFGCVGRRDLG